MRLDKFLQISRIVKRRTVANKLCNLDRVSVNGQIAKASKNVAIGARISISSARDNSSIEYEILKIPSGNVSKTTASELYQIIPIEP